MSLKRFGPPLNEGFFQMSNKVTRYPYDVLLSDEARKVIDKYYEKFVNNTEAKKAAEEYANNERIFLPDTLVNAKEWSSESSQLLECPLQKLLERTFLAGDANGYERCRVEVIEKLQEKYTYSSNGYVHDYIKELLLEIEQLGGKDKEEAKCCVCGGSKDLKHAPIMTGGTLKDPCTHPVCMRCMSVWYDSGITDSEELLAEVIRRENKGKA